MSRIVVVGAGFAGLWSAVGAVRTARGLGRDDVVVTLVAPNRQLVIRPRLYEDDPARMGVELDRVLGPVGVEHLCASVTSIDALAHTLTCVDDEGSLRTIGYDRLVLASGSQMVTPEVPGAEGLFDVDTMASAVELHEHLARLAREPQTPGAFTAVVVGGGFTGLEVVTELPGRLAAVAGGRPVRVVLVDRGEQVGQALGEGPRAEIAGALEALGVEVHLGTRLESLDGSHVVLSDGTELEAATVVWTAGMRASSLTGQFEAEQDSLGRLVVDEHLRVKGVGDVFAAGDVAAAQADEEHRVMQACQHAVPLGKHAGHNVAADLLGAPLAAFRPDGYVTCLDLGPERAVFTTGWDREVQLVGAEAKQLKGRINTEWIYPPVDDAELILASADHRTTWPIDA